jgi:hypothetical protein
MFSRVLLAVLAGAMLVTAPAVSAGPPSISAVPPFLVGSLGPETGNDSSSPWTLQQHFREPSVLVRSYSSSDPALVASGFKVSSGHDELGLALVNARVGATTRFAHGVSSNTAFGQVAVVVTPKKTEQYLVIAHHRGVSVWRWRLDVPLGLVPRVGSDGYVGFVDGHRLTEDFAIAPPQVFDQHGRDISPQDLHWTITRAAGAWRLELRLDDRSLPTPYVIDPAIWFNVGLKTNGPTTAAASIALAVPAGIKTGDLLIAHVAWKGGSNVTATQPGGWTQIDATRNQGTNIGAQVWYKTASAGDVNQTNPSYTWSLSPNAIATGGIVTYTGVDRPVSVQASQLVTAPTNDNVVYYPALTPSQNGSMVVSVAAWNRASNGGNLTPPAGVNGTSTELWETVNSGGIASELSFFAQSTAAAVNTSGSNSLGGAQGRNIGHVSFRLALKPDTTAPTGSITAPAAGGHLIGSVSVSSNSADQESGVASAQFQKATSSGGPWSNIGQADTSSPYSVSWDTTTSADGYYYLRVVTTDAAGNTANSAAVQVQVVNVPYNTSAPLLTGTSLIGEELTGFAGDWGGAFPISFSWQWQRCSDPNTCSNISGATSQTYTLGSADADSLIRLKVTGGNTYGSSDAYSSVSLSVLASGDATQAANDLRPILRYDSGEHWRPLNIDYFLAEDYEGSQVQWHHEICAPTPGCQYVTDESPATNSFSLSGYTGSDAYIDVVGNPHVGIGRENSYYTPGLDCDAPPSGVVDCDTGPRSSIYYRLVDDQANSLRYFDYWVFYRYNNYPLDEWDHEADWEGITLVYDPLASPAHVVYAYYAQDAGGTWVTSPYLVGSQTVSYVTVGGHGDYPDSCVNWEFNCPADRGNRDGALMWGRDSGLDCNSQCVLPFDSAWVSWSGGWGSNADDGDYAGPISSPGNQGRYHCVTSLFTTSGCNTPPFMFTAASSRATPPLLRNVVGRGARRAFGHRSADQRASQSDASSFGPASQCASWFGSSAPVVLCDQDVLETTLQRHQFSAPRTFDVTLVGAQREVFAIPGLTQVIGRPLPAGASMTVRGHAAHAITLWVRYRDGQSAKEARFDNVLIPAGEAARLDIGRSGRSAVAAIELPSGQVLTPASVRSPQG